MIKQFQYISIVVSILLFGTLSSCQKDDFAPVLTDEELCELSYLIPVSVIYERIDVNQEKRLISCYHTPLTVTGTDTSACIYPLQRLPDTQNTGFYFLGVDDSRKKRLFGVQILAPVWTLDGEWLTWSNNRNIYRMPISGDTLDYNRVQQITRDSVLLSRPLWSPDQQKLLVYASFTENGRFFTQDGFYVVSPDGSSQTKVFDQQGEATWRNANELIILADKTLFNVNIITGEISEINTFGNDVQNIRTPKMSPNGTDLFVLVRMQGEEFFELDKFDLQTLQLRSVLSQRVLDFSFLSPTEIVVIMTKKQISVLNKLDLSSGKITELHGFQTAR